MSLHFNPSAQQICKVRIVRFFVCLFVFYCCCQMKKVTWRGTCQCHWLSENNASFILLFPTPLRFFPSSVLCHKVIVVSLSFLTFSHSIKRKLSGRLSQYLHQITCWIEDKDHDLGNFKEPGTYRQVRGVSPILAGMKRLQVSNAESSIQSRSADIWTLGLIILKPIFFLLHIHFPCF